MEKRKIRVVWQYNAEKSLLKFHKFIAADSPKNADRFIDRLFEFGNTLNNFPEKYPLNRFPKYKNRNYRTAVFEHDYPRFSIRKDQMLKRSRKSNSWLNANSNIFYGGITRMPHTNPAL